jgi:hypothetical protein
MAETPNNDIEKQLRDYAAHRRDAAGTPQMHPATRQVLQAEVKKQFATSSRGARPRGWLVFWPRLAMALSVFAIIAVAVVVLQKESQPAAMFDLAKNESSGEFKAAPPLEPSAPSTAPVLTAAPLKSDAVDNRLNDAAPPVNAPATSVSRSRPAKGGMKSADGYAAATFGGAMQAQTANVDPAGQAGVAQVRELEGGLADKDTLATAGKAGPVPQNDLASGNDTSRTTANIAAAAAPNEQQALAYNNASTQRFRNLGPPPAARRTDVPAVLDEFVVEQDGNNLKIVDRDGSVYNGYVRAATDTEATSNLNYYVNNTAQFNQAPSTLNATVTNQIADSRIVSNFAAAEANPTMLAGGAAQAQNWSVPQNYMFEVEGTNRSSRQRVVFNGNLIQNTVPLTTQNGQAVQMQNYQRQGGTTTLQNAVSQQLGNNYINGRVYLGNSRSSTELNALSVDQ